jgi:hypothetical protein
VLARSEKLKQTLRSRVIKTTERSAENLGGGSWLGARRGAADGLFCPAECGGWSAVARGLFNPSLTRRRQELFFIFLDLQDKRLITGIFMLGGPEDHFGEDGS